MYPAALTAMAMHTNPAIALTFIDALSLTEAVGYHNGASCLNPGWGSMARVMVRLLAALRFSAPCRSSRPPAPSKNKSRTALKRPDLSYPMESLKVEYINPFIVSARTLFSSMAKLDISLEKPWLRGPREAVSRMFELAVCVELRGQTHGTVGVYLSRPVACALASALTGAPYTAITEECRDALGEVGNMLVGQAKAKLPGGLCLMSLPRIIDAAEMEFPPSMPVIHIPIDTPAGRFIIAVGCRTATGEPTDLSLAV